MKNELHCACGFYTHPLRHHAINEARREKSGNQPKAKATVTNMARLIEVLKKRDTNPSGPIVPAPAGHAETLAPGPEGSEPAFSFIELDGVTRQIDGSADVLAAPSRHKKLVVPTKRPENAHPKGRPDVNPISNVAYHPWPAAPAVKSGLAAELVAFHEPDHAASQQYFSLLSRLLDRVALPQVLLFPSRLNDSSGPVLVLNLALSACLRLNHRVAVIEADVRQPGIQRLLGRESDFGLQQVLEGKIALEQAVQSSPVCNLYSLSLTKEAEAPWSWLSREAWSWLFGCLRQRFAVILIDGSAWEGTREQDLLASVCDGVHPVVHGEGEADPAGLPWVRALASQGTRIRGIIQLASH